MLAKTNQNILEHTLDVVEGCSKVLDFSGDFILNMFQIQDKNRFKKLLILSAWLHDVGKANTHFQLIIQQAIQELKTYTPQAVRHEALSYLFVNKEEIRAWLEKSFHAHDVDIVGWVVAGHHRKFPPDLQKPTSGAQPTLTAYWNTDNIQEILQNVQKEFNLDQPPILNKETFDSRSYTNGVRNHILHQFEYVDDYDSTEWVTEDDKRLIAALKISLMLGDVMGSIKGKNGDNSIYEVISESLNKTLTSELIQEIIQEKQKGLPLYDHQKQAGTNPERITLVQAGCGSGKTIYAYQWASQKAVGKKLYFCYPTMGTASQGYEDYLDKINDTSVYHSTSYAKMLDAIQNHDPSEKEALDKEDITTVTNDAFRVIPNKVLACTADTVLGMFHYYRHSIMGLMGFANAVFVFDEIHSYDKIMWNSLLKFIKLGTTCLLMTASLPEQRLQELKDALGDEPLGLPNTSNPSETLPRYIKKSKQPINPDQLLFQVNDSLQNGAKILWISNTVDVCIHRYKTFVKNNPNVNAYCYHSRFKIVDRDQKQFDMINQFKKDQPVIAFTTQIAEMSLDISADILVSDICPVPNLIQRLGRLNRNGKSDYGYLYLSDIASHNPYELEEIEEGQKWAVLEIPHSSKISQHQLNEFWKNHQSTKKMMTNSTKNVNLLDEIIATRRDQLRETEGWNVSVILPDDAQIVRNCKKLAYKYRIKVHLYPSDIPMFRQWEQLDRTFDFIPRKRDFTYSPEWGAICNQHNR